MGLLNACGGSDIPHSIVFKRHSQSTKFQGRKICVAFDYDRRHCCIIISISINHDPSIRLSIWAAHHDIIKINVYRSMHHHQHMPKSHAQHPFNDKNPINIPTPGVCVCVCVSKGGSKSFSSRKSSATGSYFTCS
jgi:hypothetical protein